MLKTKNEETDLVTQGTNKNKRTAILINGKARCGKDTLAKILYRNLAGHINGNIGILPNASSVKELAFQEFMWNRLKDDKGRQLLINITEAGYNYDPYFWEKKTIQKIIRDNLKVVFIPDWRYYNTYQFFKDCGFNVIAIHLERTHLKNELSEELQNDISEQGFDSSVYDYNIINSSDDLDHLEQLIVDLFIPNILKRIESNE